MARQFQLAVVTWLALATVQSIVVVRMHSMSITTRAPVLRPLPRPVPLFHPVSEVGSPSDVTSSVPSFHSTIFANFILYSSDSVTARVLANGVNVVGQVSIETCTAACFSSGYPLAGAEYAGQCCKFHANIMYPFCQVCLCGTKQSVTAISKTTAPQSPPATATWPVSEIAPNFVAVRTR